MNFVPGDMVKIRTGASSPVQTDVNKVGRVERVMEDCDGLINCYVRVSWGTNIVTTEADSNLFNLSYMTKKDPSLQSW